MTDLFGIYAAYLPSEKPQKLIWVCSDQEDAQLRIESLKTTGQQWGALEVRTINIVDAINALLTHGAGYNGLF